MYTDTDSTRLGLDLGDVVDQAEPGQAGFLPMEDGIESLASRLLLADQAERSIDLQYYLIKRDVTGLALLEALLRAADRGVRVRFLLDDVFTGGYDESMAALDAHPHFEIRIFNPFDRGAGGRLWSGATSFARINRRMHNKSFTVDNQVTIIGGRNIADEYFGARRDAKFGDLDVAGIGPVVQDVSTMFDLYWNHETAVPVAAFKDAPKDPTKALDAVREELAESLERAHETRYAAAVERQIETFVQAGAAAFEWAPYLLVYDSPDKGVKARAEDAPSIVTPLLESLQSAQREIVILSPYFVPRDSGVEALLELQRRGIEVTVITNSLAANNHAAVHGGYTPARKPLLEGGVSLYEVRPDAEVPGSEHAADDDALSTLHTKAFVVDRRELFIGSFNFDPRSAYINTESGVLIRSEPMAAAFAERIDGALATDTYEVFLDERGKLRWRAQEGDQEIVFEKDPESTFFQRFTAGFARILPIEGQL